jgi:hypothetical protein
MSYPKIVYNAGAGNVTLAFTFPPVQQESPNSFTAVRTDNISTDGHVQSALRRVDNFLTVNMPHVLLGTELTAWAAFMSWALGGGSFSYYPDASLGTYGTYRVESADWTPAYSSPQFYKFSFKMRKLPA